jgi:SAM-dependent methyltransferase
MTVRVCPLCGKDAEVTVRRDMLPVFQNVTYATAEEARRAPLGQFALATCTGCGFSYNGLFREELVEYDENYDNHVSSSAFADYYASLAAMLAERYPLGGRVVYDVGCGKGEFLKILCDLVPQTRGVGIDPSCRPSVAGNMRLIQSRFDGSSFGENAGLVLCRHVLEHVAEPLGFLQALADAMPDTPLFVEVPDLDWILEHKSFWDFCYEHCNYFTVPTLRLALEKAGFEVEAQSRSFGGQYQWAICRPAAHFLVTDADAGAALESVRRYSGAESDQVATLRDRAEQVGGVAVWGMATKGVMLSLMLPEGLVRGGIDMNCAKQGRYAALSAVQIHSPEWLKQGEISTVLLMNPNYLDEITQQVRGLGVSATVVTA